MRDGLRRAIERVMVPPFGGTVERAIFGTTDPDRIVDHVAAACLATCGSELDDGFLYTVSVGCVFGCTLQDDRRVVLKAYQPRWTPAFLAAVRRVQRHVHAAGFPCPEPIGEVTTVDGATFVAEREHPDPGITPVTDITMQTSASGLAALIALCAHCDEPALADHPLAARDDDGYPEPHSPIFDFAATAAGAEWIDELERRAAAVVAQDESPALVAHTDWSARNIRIAGDRIVAAYDWDSLALVKESEAVANAAATWCKTGEPGDPTPAADEIDAYIAVYESERATPLAAVQRRAARAAAVRCLAYTARCEHAIDPGEERWTSTRQRLRDDADTLLSP